MSPTPHHDADLAWDYENGFYLTSPQSRLGKALSQYELYKRIVDLPGDVLEFGVFKGASLARLLTFRSLLEAEASRRIWGFDAFGRFPRGGVESESDLAFVERFESAGGDGYSAEEISGYLEAKSFANFELVPGLVHETVPAVLERRPELRVALLHLDLDVYEPTVVVLDLLADRVVPGGLIVVDDYCAVEGATRAIDEACRERGWTVRKLPLNHAPSYIVV